MYFERTRASEVYTKPRNVIELFWTNLIIFFKFFFLKCACCVCQDYDRPFSWGPGHFGTLLNYVQDPDGLERLRILSG